MTIEAEVARLVADANKLTGQARCDARVLALLDVLKSAFPDMPSGEMMLGLADLLGRLVLASGGGTACATSLCTIVLLRAKKSSG